MLWVSFNQAGIADFAEKEGIFRKHFKTLNFASM